MKACPDYIDLMMRSLDREAAPEEEKQLRDHLAQCEACCALYETYQQINAGLAASEEEPPETLHRAVMRSIQSEKRQHGPAAWLHRFRFTAVAAVAAVLVLIFARFVPADTTVVQSAASTARSADVAVPSVEAELRPAAAEGETLDTAAVAEETAEEPVEAEELSPEYDGAVAATVREGGLDAELNRLVSALHDAGLQGDVCIISGITTEDLEQILSAFAVKKLDSGEIVYEADQAEVRSAVESGVLNVDAMNQEEGQFSYLVLE